MSKLHSLFDTFSEIVGSHFAVFDDIGKLIYVSDIEDDIIKKMKMRLDSDIEVEYERNKMLRIKPFIFENKKYRLFSCQNVEDQVRFDDPFLNRVAFMFDDVPYSIGITRNGTIIYRNKYTADLLGVSYEKKDTNPLFGTVIEADREKLAKAVEESVHSPQDIYVTFNTGQQIYITISSSEFQFQGNTYLIISVTDLTEMKRNEEKAITEKEYLDRTLESISEGIIILDFQNKITLFNSVASSLLSKSKIQVLYKNIDDVLVFTDSTFQKIDLTNKEDSTIEGYSLADDGLMRNLKLSISNITSVNNQVLGRVLVLTDLSESKRREEEILYLSYHDVLTGAYNRTFFEEEIRRLDTSRSLPLSIIMGDLNGLKLTNDIFGHHAGDELLRRSAEILKQATRSEDILARWGGDEFIILLPKTNEESVRVIMDRISRKFGTELSLSKRGFSPSISLGYSVKVKEDEEINELISIAEKNMYKRKMLSKGSVYSGAITSMKTVLFEKSNETEEHTNRLYKMAKIVAQKFNISNEEHSDLELLCMLHDIGKIGIDDSILKKTGPLTDIEWIEMRRHSEVGFRIAQAIPELKAVALLILYHHEKFDGTGYPQKLSGYDIPLLSRIISVVDAYDAMTNDRTYRKALSEEDAIIELKANSGTQFDPDVVNVFLDTIK